jgi:hypothetical protein
LWTECGLTFTRSGVSEPANRADVKGFTAPAEVPPIAAWRGSARRPTLDLSPEVLDILLIMSSADGWDLTVPEDAAELLAELRRHGVRPGQRLHVVRAAGSQRSDRLRP